MELTTFAQTGGLAHNGESVTAVPATGEWVMEPKLDGWRLIAHVRESDVCFYSRSGKTYNGKLPMVEAELLEHFPADTWLDGEAVAITVAADGKVINEWSKAQSVLTTAGAHGAADKITYMVFDLIAHRGIDARPLAFQNRRKLMEKAISGKGMTHVMLVPQFEATAERHTALVAIGFEGSMLKRLDAKYASGRRGHGLAKWKAVQTADAVVIGFQPGKSSFAGMVGAIRFGQVAEDGMLRERGKCSGMDMQTRMDMTNNPEKWMGRVIEVSYNGKVGAGLRHPQFQRVREDKSAEQCVWS